MRRSLWTSVLVLSAGLAVFPVQSDPPMPVPPWPGECLATFRGIYLEEIALSPDGRYLLGTLSVEHPPADWAKYQPATPELYKGMHKFPVPTSTSGVCAPMTGGCDSVIATTSSSLARPTAGVAEWRSAPAYHLRNE